MKQIAKKPSWVKPKWHKVKQGTGEWNELRCGKVTASHFAKVMANFPGDFGVQAQRLAKDIAVERITGKKKESSFSNHHTDRGIAEEPFGIAKYELETFSDVSEGGFFDGGLIGYSPDGIVGQGLLEVKSVIKSVHEKNEKRQSWNPAHTWQLIGGLYVSGKDWIDYVSYCHEEEDEKQALIFRLERNEESESKILDLHSRLIEFEEAILNQVKSMQLQPKEYENEFS